ncbi:arylesterase [Acetobacteraceae bacterium]|nr:arylesterase [Candidatus Parcubacteria bacterium]
MRTYILAGFALLVIAVALVWFITQREADVTNYPSSGTDIIAFGDSLVFGTGASNEGGFVSLLEEKIDRPIVNLGVSGDTTASGLARIGVLDTYNPKIVLLLLGGNDRLRETPPQETFSNLAKIIEDLQKRGAVVVLLGIRGGILSDSYEKQFQMLRDTYHTAYVPDVLRGLFSDSHYMSDAIHPNDAGYAKIAERVYPILDKFLQ